jgi:hypothetical protein
VGTVMWVVVERRNMSTVQNESIDMFSFAFLAKSVC